MDNPFAQFNTEKSPILFQVKQSPVAWLNDMGIDSDTDFYTKAYGYKAIVRVSRRGPEERLLNIVGEGYKIIHNSELFERIEATMLNEMLPEHFEKLQVHDRVSGWGRVCYREYIFPAIKCKLAYNQSDIGFRIIVQNGYGGSALRIHSGAIDFFCTNGMIHGEFTSTYRRHTSGIVIGNLTSTIQESLAQFASQQVIWNRWVNTPVKVDGVAELFDKVSTSTKMREGLLDQYERESDSRGKNLWAVYSAMTYYASHSDGQFTLRRSVEEADTVASTMLTRELNVSKWLNLPEFKKLELVDG